ncbi:MAG: zinc-ribbon domain-containing protein [Chloroflexi bacterium]|nr:MAG: zinc-ribbon domain-containing protein [Chloroflexota bacterium]
MAACPSCGEANPDRARFCLNCGAALSAQGATERAHETRRRVTVLFTDVAGSTSIGEQLDPEALREVMQRYFDAMRVAIERHEGTVEKFIGDAVMAVFGIPQLHEDDALRAVRAAFDMQTSLETLNRDIGARWGVELAIRTGINTGEVVAGDATTGQALATGDVVNTAARLEQAAGPGQVLIGAETHRLVRQAVTAGRAEPLTLKGKAEPVPAWLLTGVDASASAQERRMDSPMVGRDRQLRILTDAAERARVDRAPQLVTVLGLAGVGKSRLVHEFLGRVRADATVIRGRCLSYGDAITYWPLSEALRAAAGIQADDSVDQATDRVQSLAGNVPQAGVIARRVAGAIGLVSDESATAGGQETFWAIRRLFEAMARARPLVAVFDDVQWGTPTFLDLLEHITDWSREAPILLLAIARPELLEARPTWGGGKLNATTLLLEPLDDAAVDEILTNLVGSRPLPVDLARKIEDAAEGNPFFVEELLAMLVDDGVLERDGDAFRVTRTPSEIAVPPTIELLLAARLDHLPADERATLGRASVVGKRFGASEVAQLSPETERETSLMRLMALVRKELVRLDEQAAADLDALDEEMRFRFRHQLVRDAAYEALPKHERAHLHEVFADWMEHALPHRMTELHEVVAHHLEQACLYRRSVGGASEAAAALARRAVTHFAAAVDRSQAVGDMAATARLLERALALLPKDDPGRPGLLVKLTEPLAELARLQDAYATVEEVLASPAADDAARARALETVELLFWLGWAAADVEPRVEEALAIRRRLGEPGGIARALLAKIQLEWFRGHLSMGVQLAEEALPLAQAADDIPLESRLRGEKLVSSLVQTHRTKRDDRETYETLEFARKHGHLVLEAVVLRTIAHALAEDGEYDQAIEMNRRGRAIMADMGMKLMLASGAGDRHIEEWFGHREESLRLLREEFQALQELGERAYLSTVAGELALRLLDEDRVEEAREAAKVAVETGAADDLATQVALAAFRARILAREGKAEDAERLAREVVALADTHEFFSQYDLARETLADVLRWSGRLSEARRVIEDLADHTERRANRTYAATLRRRAEGLVAPPGVIEPQA